MPTHLAFLIYILVALGAMLLIVLAARSQYRRRKLARRTETPEEFVLLRQPEESLRRELEKLGERVEQALVTMLCWVFALMATGVWLVIMAAAILSADFAGQMLAFGALALLVAEVWVVVRWQTRKLDRLIDQRERLRLGLRGERHVAEQLEPLARQGWRLFHDVPMTVNGHAQNLDHVALGPQGLVVVETKTRSKPVRESPKKAEVRFDGQRLIWSGHAEEKTAWQVRQQAEWLRDWLKRECGLEARVFQMIAIPGWTVHPGNCYEPRVVSGRAVSGALASMLEGEPALLDGKQIQKAEDKLGALCRDVLD